MSAVQQVRVEVKVVYYSIRCVDDTNHIMFEFLEPLVLTNMYIFFLF